MAPHDGVELGGIGRAAGRGLHDRGDIPEVVRTEDAGADDRKHGGVDVAVVVEAVDSAAADADDLSGPDIDGRALDPGCLLSTATIAGLPAIRSEAPTRTAR